jgi:hypothetical protein
MKRWLTHLIIAAYLGSLSYGVVAYAVTYKLSAHPAMYFIVWDMFCGWASHASRLQIIGEGESGKFYELAPGPWGEIRPFGDIGRRHYDTYCLFSPEMARNCLKQTKHEPMVRVFVIEECWPKKYNLPDRVWNYRHAEPKDPHHYYHARIWLDGNGVVQRQQQHWLAYQNSLCLSNNPRLMADTRRGRPFYNVSMTERRAAASFYSRRRDAGARRAQKAH